MYDQHKSMHKMNVFKYFMATALFFIAAEAYTAPNMYIFSANWYGQYNFYYLNPNTGQTTPLSPPVRINIGDAITWTGTSAFDQLKQIYYSGVTYGEVTVGNVTHGEQGTKISLFGKPLELSFDYVNRRLLLKTEYRTSYALLSASVDGEYYKWTPVFLFADCCFTEESGYYFDSDSQIYYTLQAPYNVSAPNIIMKIDVTTGKVISSINLGLPEYNYQSMVLDKHSNLIIALGVDSEQDNYWSANIALIGAKGIKNTYSVTAKSLQDQPLFLKFDASSRSALVFFASYASYQTYIIAINVDTGNQIWTSPYFATSATFNAEFVPVSVRSLTTLLQ